MGLRSLSLSLTMDGVTVERPFGLSQDETVLTKEELVEALTTSILHGFNNKPDLLKGMLTSLLDDVEKQRKYRR